jgi:hypothetical protein
MPDPSITPITGVESNHAVFCLLGRILGINLGYHWKDIVGMEDCDELETMNEPRILSIVAKT